MDVVARRALLGVIDTAAGRLADAGVVSSRLDAEVLMAEAAAVSREAVVIGSIDPTPAVLRKFEAMVARREKREPIAYILGHKEFYSLDFEVTPAVLIPRPETEFVVDAALESIAAKANARVLDIGTGSGAIAIAIAVNAPTARVTATDISTDALEVASRNARRHQVHDRVIFRRADCFETLDGGPALAAFDVIAANPPYLDEAELAALAPDVKHYEPRVALTAGVDGFDVMLRIANGAAKHLAGEGALIMEVNPSRIAELVGTLLQAGLRVFDMINDLAGLPRVVHARKAEA
jgi:release factor glutamine methyltransferase